MNDITWSYQHLMLRLAQMHVDEQLSRQSHDYTYTHTHINTHLNVYTGLIRKAAILFLTTLGNVVDFNN